MQLLVNIDHVATLRNARGEGYPDPLRAAKVCENAGAAGIVFHLREDRRHIQDEDVLNLKDRVQGITDLEMASTDEMLQIAANIQPDLITLVPEKREELTTEGGLDLPKIFDDYQSRVFPKIQDAGSTVSLFVDPAPEYVEMAAKLGSDAIELHTGAYSNAQSEPARKDELGKLKKAAEAAHDLEMQVNAGHGLNLGNFEEFIKAVPHLHDVSIGHALIAEAIFKGLEATVKEFLGMMSD
jgi:pyridoxine 5-phosphate synthase